MPKNRALTLALVTAMLAITGPALADPALWRVKGHGSTVYLFGTMHLADPNRPWRTPAIDQALGDSSEVWLEIPLPVVAEKGKAPALAQDEAQRIGQLMASLGVTTEGPPLTSRLTPVEADLLRAYLPVPPARLERLRPWLAAMQVSAARLTKLGLSGAAGADYTIQQNAQALGKPVHGFETLEQQLHFFADLGPDEELAFLRQNLADAGEGEALLAALERAWRAGDDEAVMALAVGRMRERWPLLYRRFNVERNKSWIPQIEAMLKTPGVRFIAVGDGHLLGPDGVPSLLRKDGWRVERVPSR